MSQAQLSPARVQVEQTTFAILFAVSFCHLFILATLTLSLLSSVAKILSFEQEILQLVA